MTITFGTNQTHSVEAAGFPWEGGSPGEAMGMPELQCSPGFPGTAQQGEKGSAAVGAVASLRVLHSCWDLLCAHCPFLSSLGKVRQ